MEVAVVLGGAYLLLAQAAPAPVHKNKMEMTPEEENAVMLERPRDMVMSEARVRGIVAPTGRVNAGRAPFDPQRPPYAVYYPNHDNTAQPTERLYSAYANAQEHERLLVKNELQAGRMHYARKSGQPVWSAYNRELHVPNADPFDAPRTTNHQGWSWLPPNPHDMDFVEAGLLAKAMPPNDALLSPEGFYFAAPGVTWRHGVSQH